VGIGKEFKHLLCELPCGANADGLGDPEVGVDAAEHAQDETGGLAGAVVRLSDEVLVGRREYHGEGDGLDLTRAAEPHLVVQPLEQLRRQLQILERRRRLVHRAARSQLERNQININQPISYGDRLGLAGGAGGDGDRSIRLGFGSRRSHRGEAGPPRQLLPRERRERESFDLLGLRLHGRPGFRSGP
jgi:hypothetical protein